MPENNSIYLRWQVPNYRRPNRDRNWYIIASVFIISALFFCFFTIASWHLIFLGRGANFLFALIIIMASIIMLINENQPVTMLNCELGPEGFKMSGRLYEYSNIKNFSVIYKPKESLKSLYFEFNSTLSQRLSVPLRNMDPLTIRNFLLKYLKEDLDRINAPLSEQLTKMLKL